MPTIVIETIIDAMAERCFDLVRDPRIQAEPRPVITGEFGVGQRVTFTSRKFGVSRDLIVEVTEFDRPLRMVDEMVEGPFAAFRHVHEFITNGNCTLMRDTLEWTSPLGILGKVADGLMLRRTLTKIVRDRNDKLKSLAERPL
jgi:ligand-binding SRPBCC domain-containing protein